MLSRIAAVCLMGMALALPARANPASLDRATAMQLATLINQYRLHNGLPPVPVSPSLTMVAEAHALDTASEPDGGVSLTRGRDRRGVPCNGHSWSSRGPWKAVCYTIDERYADAMWSKPREITRGGYSADGFEIDYQTTGQVTASDALEGWMESPEHLDVILERGMWDRSYWRTVGYKDSHWRAMGVGVAGYHAYVWFGKDPDTVGAPAAATTLASAGF
jgi:hypothetical protein